MQVFIRTKTDSLWPILPYPAVPHCHHLTVSSYANTNTLREKKRKVVKKYKEKSQKGKRKRGKESIKRKVRKEKEKEKKKV